MLWILIVIGIVFLVLGLTVFIETEMSETAFTSNKNNNLFDNS